MISSKVQSHNTSLQELQEQLKSSIPSVTWYGSRQVSIEGIEGSVSLSTLATRVLSFVTDIDDPEAFLHRADRFFSRQSLQKKENEKPFSPNLSFKERLAGIRCIDELNKHYATTNELINKSLVTKILCVVLEFFGLINKAIIEIHRNSESLQSRFSKLSSDEYDANGYLSLVFDENYEIVFEVNFELIKDGHSISAENLQKIVDHGYVYRTASEGPPPRNDLKIDLIDADFSDSDIDDGEPFF